MAGPGAPAVPRVWISSDGRPSRNVSAVVVLRDMLPGLVAMTCGALSLVVSTCIRLQAMKLIVGVLGVVLCLFGAMLMNLKLTILRPLQQNPPQPKEVRNCVWAVSSFGELLAGKSAALSVEVVGSAQWAGQAAQIPQSPEGFPQPTFAHEPRLEQTACPCCLQEFGHQTRVAVVRCGHMFCEPCLREWAVAEWWRLPCLPDEF